MAWNYQKCPKCGSMIFSKEGEPLKCKCAKLRKSSGYHGHYDAESYFVVKDPLPVDEGGFRKGTLITSLQADCMCQVGTFSDGTILQSSHNRRYQVATNLEGKQSLLLLT